MKVFVIEVCLMSSQDCDYDHFAYLKGTNGLPLLFETKESALKYMQKVLFSPCYDTIKERDILCASVQLSTDVLLGRVDKAIATEVLKLYDDEMLACKIHNMPIESYHAVEIETLKVI